MDQEFIEIQHRDNVKLLMEICNVGMEEAFNLYTTSNNDIQRAINSKINLASKKREMNPPNYMHNILNSPINPQEDIKFKEYRIFIEKGVSFDRKYNFNEVNDVNKKSKKETKLDNYLNKRSTNRQSERVDTISVKNKLESFIQIQIDLKIQHSEITEILYLSWKERFPAAILILNFTQEIKQVLKLLFADKFTLNQIFNKYFKFCCVEKQKIKLPKWLQPFINLQNDCNHFIIARVNCRDQIEVINKIDLENITLQQFKKMAKSGKTECIQRQLDQMHIVKEFNEVRKGNRNYQRPKQIKQKIMLRQDQRLKRQQDEAFFKAYKSIKETVEKKQEKQDKKEQKKEQIRKQRQQGMQKLIKYEEGCKYKIRFPCGKNLLITLPATEKIDYLFKYVQYFPQEIGFQHDLNRRFDILRIDEPKSLKDKRQMEIGQILQQSQSLNVKQLDGE